MVKYILSISFCLLAISFAMVCGQRLTGRKKSTTNLTISSTSSISSTQPPPSLSSSSAVPASLPDQQTPPAIDWGKCGQLAPSRAEHQRKAELTEICFKRHPIPAQPLTERRVKLHTKQIMECALRADNWFDKRGRYRFSRALTRISGKKLPKDIETKLTGHIGQCRKEAEQKYPKKQQIIDLVGLFQACMNYYTTNVCNITIMPNPSL